MKVNPATSLSRFRIRAQAPTQPLLWLTVGLLLGVTLTLSLTCWLNNRPSVALSQPPSPQAAAGTQQQDGLFLKTYRVQLQHELKDQNPRQWLENQGISFPATGSAIYNGEAGLLTVSNSIDNLELVDLLIESFHAQQQHEMLQVYLKTRIVEMSRSDYKEDIYDDQLPEASDIMPVLKGVFTDPQFQVVWRAITQKGGMEHREPEPVVLRSGTSHSLPLDSDRFTISPVVGADNFTLDLNLSDTSQPGLAEIMVTVWTGQTIYVAYPTEDPEKVGMMFITARIVDPAGQVVDSEIPPDA